MSTKHIQNTSGGYLSVCELCACLKAVGARYLEGAPHVDPRDVVGAKLAHERVKRHGAG